MGGGTEIGTALFWTELSQFTTIRAKRTSQLRYCSDEGRHNCRPIVFFNRVKARF